MRRILFAGFLGLILINPAAAHDGRPSRWCGWYMRFHNGRGDPGPAYNLARNWAHWGQRAFAAAIGVVVVWPHHVGKIVGSGCKSGYLIESGNDGHAVRTRCRPIVGAIALRW
jgi:hypothetical protein